MPAQVAARFKGQEEQSLLATSFPRGWEVIVGA